MCELCENLHTVARKLRRWGQEELKDLKIKNGVYIVFERGEFAHNGERIVRVGSHTGEGNCAKRIRSHFKLAAAIEKKRGNRGSSTPKDRSVFRKHVGKAFLKDDPFFKYWDANRSIPEVKARLDADLAFNFDKLLDEELRVTEYLRANISFAVLPFGNAAEACKAESGLIALVHRCSDCRASSDWLGGSHPDTLINSGKLWNKKDLDAKPITAKGLDEAFADAT